MPRGQTAHMPTCGESGYVTKAGTPCGFRVGKGKACPHHDPDPTRLARIQAKSRIGVEAAAIPQGLKWNTLETVAQIRDGYAQVVSIASSQRRVDLKRLDVIIRALNGATGLVQVEAMKDLNETLLRAEGHGAGLVILEGLKAGAKKRLPGMATREIQQSVEAMVSSEEGTA